MITRVVIGSAEVLLIQRLYLACFSLLQATANTAAAILAVEVATANIGHQGRIASAPIASTSTAVMSV